MNFEIIHTWGPKGKEGYHKFLEKDMVLALYIGPIKAFALVANLGDSLEMSIGNLHYTVKVTA